jgi:hypothetical protein
MAAFITAAVRASNPTRIKKIVSDILFLAKNLYLPPPLAGDSLTIQSIPEV